jgi:uncharacterized protein YlzI (FlbEa/FlbD family)
MKLIKLTYHHSSPNERGMDKIKNITNKKNNKGSEKDAEWYIDMGLPVPEDINNDIDFVPDENGFIEIPLEEDEVDIKVYQMFINAELIDYMIQFDKFTTLYLSDGTELNVEEKVDDINNKLN